MMLTRKSILLLISVLSQTASGAWFEQSGAIFQAHKALLENKLSVMFPALTEAWQEQSHNDDFRNHVNELLNTSLAVDCGKSLSHSSYPSWLNSVDVIHHSLERPGRVSYFVDLVIKSDVKIVQASLNYDAESLISKENSVKLQEQGNYHRRFQLNHSLKAGLYQLNILTEDEQWNDWIVIYDDVRDQELHWVSREKWEIEKKRLLNPSCPLPVQEVTLFDYSDGIYRPVWSESYEQGAFSHSLSSTSLPSNKYVLRVSLSHSRYQGIVTYSDKHTLSRILDLTKK